MIKLFSDYYSARENFLTRMDARVKLLIATSAIVAVILSRNPLFPSAIFLFCTVMMLLIGLPVKAVAGRLGGPIGLAAVVLLLQAVISGATPVYAVSFYGFEISLKSEGIKLGMLTASRMIGCAGLFILLAFVTPAHRLFAALRAVGIPPTWVETATHTYRGVFVLLESATEMYSAQKVRLGFSGTRRGMENAGTLAGSVVLRSVEKAALTHDAMRARGYDGAMPYAPLPSLAKGDYATLVLAFASTAAVFLILETGL